jgi:hypothetical protein
VLGLGKVLALPPPDAVPIASRPEPTWTRLVPKFPIQEPLLENLHDRLDNIRSRALDRIQSFEGGPRSIRRDHIRVNIFLPDTAAISAEGIYELYIPKRLQVGMEPSSDSDHDRSAQERSIRFKPNQGATGVAFIENTSQMARAVKTGKATCDWEEKYSLTDAQKRAVHPELKWVISFPLTSNEEGRLLAMGVLNVDGLACELEDGHLRILLGELTGKVAAISGLLAQNEKCKISLFVEDI